MVGGIRDVGTYGEFGGFVIRTQLGTYKGIPQRNLTTCSEVNILPQSHVFVGRRWVPIYPGNAKISFVWRGNLYGKYVLSRIKLIGNIKFEGAKRSGYILIVGDLLPINPDIGSIVDGIKMQPDLFVVEIFRKCEFGTE